MTKIKSADILPGDVVKFEFGDYDNWVTVRVDQVEFTNETGRYRQKLIWHYLSDEAKSPATCPQPVHSTQYTQYTQYTCYGDPNEFIDLIERK